jgi:hypothetical protein
MDGIKTQGTHLFMLNPLGSDPTIVKLVCPTGVSGLGGPADQLETTCLDNLVDKSFIRGLGTPGQVTVPFNLLPDEVSHQDLFTLKDAGVDITWLLCLSESQTAPSVLDSEGLMVPPSDRTCFAFTGYIADVNIDVAGNTIVTGTLLVQRSGAVTPHWIV